jgi:hypothetical protein
MVKHGAKAAICVAAKGVGGGESQAEEGATNFVLQMKHSLRNS